MTYRSVLFTVPVQDVGSEDDPRDWVRRELVLEGLLEALHGAARPTATPAVDAAPEAAPTA